MSTETPLTDAAEAAHDRYASLSDGKVRLDLSVPFAPGGFAFARQLERDLTTAEAERDALLLALRAIEPFLDVIVCYASTVEEFDGNRAVAIVRDLLAILAAKPT
jgi:hypothetical protein